MFNPFQSAKQRPPIETLFEAYKVGQMPLALVTLGALCILATFGFALPEFKTDPVDPVAGLFVGGAIVSLGGILWAVSLSVQSRFQIATLNLVVDVVRQAGSVAKDGANFKVGIEDFTRELPKVISAIATVSPSASAEQSGRK